MSGQGIDMLCLMRDTGVMTFTATDERGSVMQPTWTDTLTLRMEQALTRAAVLDAELARERDPETRRELHEAVGSWREEARRLEGRANRAHRRASRKQGVGA